MKVIFVVGTGRCGSTLVQEVLARHEAFGFVSNIEDRFRGWNRLGRWNSRLYRSPLGAWTRKGGLRFAPSEAYRLISREVSPIYADSCRDLVAGDVTPWLAGRFARFFESRYLAQQRPLFLHKYTGWPRMGFLQCIFPDAKFIHIVRDGRAVANSWLQMPWWGGYQGDSKWHWGDLPVGYRREWEADGCSFISLAAITWKILIDAFEQAEQTLAPRSYLRVRYEDIIAEPDEYFPRLLEFCGAEWTSAFDAHFRRQRFRSDRLHAFENDLAKVQVQEMEKHLGAHLSRYGYV